MKPFLILYSLLIISITSCSRGDSAKFKSSWKSSPDGIWVGPELWANRLQDWKVEDGRLICTGTKPMRTVVLTTMVAAEREGTINCTVNISLNSGERRSAESAAGILIGAGRGLDYRAASLIHHSYGKLAGLFVGLDGQGNLFLRDFEKENEYLYYEKRQGVKWDEATLILSLRPFQDKYKIKVTAVDPTTNQVIDSFEMDGLESIRTEGGVALVSHPGYSTDSENTYSFSNWRVSGSKLDRSVTNSIGPIIGIQYTLSRGTLKLSAQFPPIGSQENHNVDLQLFKDGEWVSEVSSIIGEPSYTALFRINDYKYKTDLPFRVVYSIDRAVTEKFYQEGIIKHDPVEQSSITLLSLSCIEQVVKPDRNSWMGIDAGTFPWNWAILYPHNQLVENLNSFSADILFFAGDQVYEGASPTVADTGPNVELDYLYKWFLWCQTYISMTAKIPSIAIPDDHDVYHGNIWGAGGIATPEGSVGAAAQDAGGYKRSARFVNMVQTTQTSHLPDPYSSDKIARGIGVYYTECNIGGVSFAVLEDRKFKSAPKALLPVAEIYNGWPINPNWSTRNSSRVEATLLGDRQLEFLDKWSGDWSNGSWMKAVLSQTLFANLATLPIDAINDNVVTSLAIPDSASYVEGDKIVSDFDSNGWPQVGRDRAIRIFRKAFATHIAGDQHLGSTVQYGIEKFGDSNFAIISPATGNIFPRRWFPPVEGRNREDNWPRNYGDFEDGFGNRITVHAVANPHKTDVEPTRHHELATGYSSIVFHRDSRNIILSNWPYYSGPETGEPFPGWPVIINQLDNYGRDAMAWLPEIVVTGIKNPVVRIINERTGEMEYAIRLSGVRFQPWVFSYGTYTIEIGEPDSGIWERLDKISATSGKERKPIELSF